MTGWWHMNNSNGQRGFGYTQPRIRTELFMTFAGRFNQSVCFLIFFFILHRSNGWLRRLKLNYIFSNCICPVGEGRRVVEAAGEGYGGDVYRFIECMQLIYNFCLNGWRNWHPSLACINIYVGQVMTHTEGGPTHTVLHCMVYAKWIKIEKIEKIMAWGGWTNGGAVAVYVRPFLLSIENSVSLHSAHPNRRCTKRPQTRNRFPSQAKSMECQMENYFTKRNEFYQFRNYLFWIYGLFISLLAIEHYVTWFRILVCYYCGVFVSSCLILISL